MSSLCSVSYLALLLLSAGGRSGDYSSGCERSCCSAGWRRLSWRGAVLSLLPPALEPSVWRCRYSDLTACLHMFVCVCMHRWPWHWSPHKPRSWFAVWRWVDRGSKEAFIRLQLIRCHCLSSLTHLSLCSFQLLLSLAERQTFTPQWWMCLQSHTDPFLSL